MAWTDKMVEDLKIMWKQGLTTGEIGKRLGVSKNSIVGKVPRLQLDARPSPIRKKDEETSEAAVENNTEKTPAAKLKAERKSSRDEGKTDAATLPANTGFRPTPAKNVASGDVKLTDLDNHTCRWPIGDPKDENFRFCGRKVRVGQTYCEEHAALAYVKPNKK